MSTPRANVKKLIFLTVLSGFSAPFASPVAKAAEDCEAAGHQYDSAIDQSKNDRDRENVSPEAQKSAQNMIDAYVKRNTDARLACEDNNRTEKKTQAQTDKEQASCNAKREKFPDAWSWDEKKKRCVSKAETASSKSLPDSDDCNSASVFAGDLKGQNCKKALVVVKDVKARNSAITDATTAATTAYSSMQATGATGAQDDAQTRQANIMKTLAMSKFVTGALNLTGAMQLKSAASGAEDANSTITGAQKNLATLCSNTTDDQACFYQNASKYGIPSDQRNYASFERMKRGAQQSQEQADAANALAKTSMLTGAADLLVGMQAMRAAQMANQNAQQMAPPPLLVPPPPPGFIPFGDGRGAAAAPGLEPGAVTAPTDYGNPSADNNTFGDARHGRVNGGMVAGKPGAPSMFKSASSGVSGGGGGGGVGGGGLRSGGSGASRGGGGRRNSAIGEFNLAGGGSGAKGASPGDKADASNPLADMLAKMFPQGQDGKTVVDARQIASASGAVTEESEQSDAVTASDLSLFEQISAKYRQLNGSGRF